MLFHIDISNVLRVWLDGDATAFQATCYHTPMESKICTKCSAAKALSDFSFKNKSKGTLASECKACHRKARNSYYASNRDVEMKRARARTDRAIAWYKEIKASLACRECGESHPACLDFHHSDPSSKEFSVAAFARRGFGIDRVKKEMEKCIVLCSNCHRKLHFEEKQEQ